MYISVLQEAPILPFSNFVSRGDIPDKIDIARGRSFIDREVYRLVRQTARDKSSRLIPILGSAGTGKTHAYHSFKDKEREDKKKVETTQAADEIEVSILPVDWSIIYILAPQQAYVYYFTCIHVLLKNWVLNYLILFQKN